jgi:hypothetical protein
VAPLGNVRRDAYLGEEGSPFGAMLAASKMHVWRPCAIRQVEVVPIC